METELRRKQVSLVTLGTGVILFGTWSVLRAVLFLSTEPLFAVDSEAPLFAILIVKVIVYSFLGLLLLVSFWLRFYIGRNARLEGMGGKPKKFYPILAAILFLVNAAISPFSLYYAFTKGLGEQSRVEFMVSFFVDLTSTILLADLLFTVRHLRRLRAQAER